MAAAAAAAWARATTPAWPRPGATLDATASLAMRNDLAAAAAAARARGTTPAWPCPGATLEATASLAMRNDLAAAAAAARARGTTPAWPCPGATLEATASLAMRNDLAVEHEDFELAAKLKAEEQSLRRFLDQSSPAQQRSWADVAGPSGRAGPGAGAGSNAWSAEAARSRAAACQRGSSVQARYTQERLLLEWRPDGTFDFLYLPFSFTERRSKGYVFINFVTPEGAFAFQRQWHGRYLSDTRHYNKYLDIASAGSSVAEHLEKLSSKISTLNARGHAPAIFRGTRRLNIFDVMHGIDLMTKQGRNHAPPSESNSF